MMKTKQTFTGKMVFIKVGLCTRKKHHFNGINLRVVVVGYLGVIIKAVNELHERATANAISKNILNCLAQMAIWRSKFAASRQIMDLTF